MIDIHYLFNAYKNNKAPGTIHSTEVFFVMELDENSINEDVKETEDYNENYDYELYIEDLLCSIREDEMEEMYADLCEREKKRGKVNRLRELRIDDLNKLRCLRRANGKEFTFHMDDKYKFLYKQYIVNYFNIYLDPCKISLDCVKFRNETLINIFDITLEEQQHMKSIISKEEINRRKNLKRRQDRRDCNGLTKRAKAKLEKEIQIKHLLEINPRLSKSEVARIMNLNKSTITRTYGHLF